MLVSRSPRTRSSRPTPSGPTPSGRRRALAAALALPLSAPLLVGTAAAADVPTLEPDEAAAGFLLRAQGQDGSFGAGTSAGVTADATVGLLSAGVGSAAVPAALDSLVAASAAYTVDDAGNLRPGAAGKVIAALAAGGRDPRSVAGEDLVDALLATRAASGPDAGKFLDAMGGETDFDTSGSLTQAVAVLALAAAGVDVPADSLAWLRTQQCADGGFEFGARPVGADALPTQECTSADTNSTGYAVQALALAPGTDVAAAAATTEGLAFLDDAQTTDGGFPFIPVDPAQDDADPTSTALALQAIRAVGEDPRTPRWTTASGGDPVAALVGQENACGAPADQRGSFPGFSSDADPFATSAVLAALAGADLPVPGADLGTLSPDTPVLGCGGLPPVDVSADACPPDAVTGAGFTDVPAGGAFTASIDCLAAGGITVGTTATTFSPGALVTRRQTVVLLYRALTELGVELETSDAGFSDVTDQSAEVRAAVDALANIGVVNGTTATTFAPTALVSRDQQASFLARAVRVVAAGDAAVAPLAPGVDTFGDDDGSVHEAAIDALARAGVTSGRSEGVYDPRATVTRQQSAAFLARTLQVVLAQAGEKGPVGA